MDIINEFKEKVLNGYSISYEEGITLSLADPKEELYRAANQIRRHFCGDGFDLCSITNAKSGKCQENCKWCAQSGFHKTGIKLYDMVDKNQAVDEAVENASMGVHRHSLVTSGRSISDKTLHHLIDIYHEIKEKCNIDLCASMGLLNRNQLLALKNAGITHYHCNLETAPSFFPTVCSTHTFEDKIHTIKIAREIGLRVCSGGIIGMGETMDQRVELACALRDLDITSIPVNIFTPIAGTPLENTAPLSEEEILTSIALFRFINPKANLRFAGGRLKIKHFQEKALKAGINAALTGNYLTTTGSDITEDVRDFTASGFNIEK